MLLYQIDMVARAAPRTLAIVCGDRGITYETLVASVRDRLLELVGEGLHAGDIVALDITHPIRFIQYALAILTLGCRLFPIPPSMGRESRARLMTELRPKAIVDNSRLQCLPALSDVRYVYPPGGVLHLTSGSYGLQKVVVRPLGNIHNEALGVASHLGLMPGHRLMAMTPLSHSLGSGLWRATLCAGATLYAPASEAILARLSELEAMMAVPMNYLFGVPYLFQVLLQRRHNLSRLRYTRCFAGGESLSGRLAERWLGATGAPLQQEYGLGEGGITTIAKPGTPSNFIGSPLPGIVLKIREQTAHGVGELVVYRPHAPTSYLLEGPDSTFISDGGIRTGDLVKEVPTLGVGTNYQFIARKKSVIVVAGLKLVPLEVEDAIRECDVEVLDVAVIAEPDARTGERPVAFVAMGSDNSDHGGIRAMIRASLSFKLSSYKVPKRIEVMRELPRTASGKVDRNALRNCL